MRTYCELEKPILTVANESGCDVVDERDGVWRWEGDDGCLK